MMQFLGVKVINVNQAFIRGISVLLYGMSTSLSAITSCPSPQLPHVIDLVITMRKGSKNPHT
jgi:hypothetical protein